MTDFAARYVDRGLLGQGGMGEVRCVYDRVLDREVAQKTLRWSLRDTPRARARFLAEATMTAGLAHPSIVPVYDRGVLPDGAPWYTMKRVLGQTLAEAQAAGLP
ncbi:MAG: protein kinase, partial [Myxococcales bacterium]|nr:protein kinase [Myxococcales bacterium]